MPENISASIPLALADDGSGTVMADVNWTPGFGQFGTDGQLDWQQPAPYSNGAGFSAHAASANGVFFGWDNPSGVAGVSGYLPSIYTRQNGVEHLPAIPGAGIIFPDAIDPSGRYFGARADVNNQETGVIWDRATNSFTLTGAFTPMDINSSGMACGFVYVPVDGGVSALPATWTREGGTRLTTLPPGATGFGEAQLITESGHVMMGVGVNRDQFQWIDSDGDHAFSVIADDVEGFDLGIRDLNDHGVAVGYRYDRSADPNSIALNTGVVWIDGVRYGLDDALIGRGNFTIVAGNAVNDSGQILAYAAPLGWVNNMDDPMPMFTVLLTPTPEPTVLSVFAATFLFALRRTR